MYNEARLLYILSVNKRGRSLGSGVGGNSLRKIMNDHPPEFIGGSLESP